MLAACADKTSNACQDVLKAVRNPYYVGDQPPGTQTTGWVDAWMSAPSVYAVAARSTADVVAAVNFARDNRLRLVVKGGGHSYQGTSDSADSLLNQAGDAHRRAAATLHVAPRLRRDRIIDMHPYATRSHGHRGLRLLPCFQSGGFGSFSKNFGTAAGGLLEAEIVTADGQVRIANACVDPDLFWGIKGGGGGSLGVVTRLTLRTRDLPAVFGGARVTVKAASDAAFRSLIARFVGFYHDSLFNTHWGESVNIGADNTLAVSMVFQGLDQLQAADAWRPFLDWVAASPRDFSLIRPAVIRDGAARNWWNAEFIKTNVPGRGFFDQRPGASPDNMWFGEQNTELGVFMHGYQSLWLPASLLQKDRQSRLADAMFAASRHWTVLLHFNKGLAGASAADVAAAQDTAMNPAVLDAFALAIIATGDPAAYADLLSPPPDLAKARRNAAAIARSADELRKIVPDAGSYVSESNFFERDWQRSFWGANYPRLRAVKSKFDPDGLFFVHHGVGSEVWSADGFTRLHT